MTSDQVNRLFRAIEHEAAEGAEDRMERLARVVGYMRGMIREAACDGVPMREIAERILSRETANA